MNDRFILNLNSPKWTKLLLVLVLIISVLMIILTQSSHLWDKYRVVPDVQNSYWMARFQDPTLFATDYLFSHRLVEVDIIGIHLILYPLSLGWGLLFHLGSFVIDHIWLSKWLVFILIPISVIYLFRFGQIVEDNLTGVSLSLIYVFFILASSQAISPVTGLQRGFAVPLLIIFLYYLFRQQFVGAAVMVVINALVYWPNVPLAVLTYGLSLIVITSKFKVSLNITWVKLLPLLVSLVISMLLVALEMVVNFDLFAPQKVSISQDPLYQSQGAAPMFISFPWLGRAGVFNIGIEVINFIVLLGLAFFIYKSVGRQSLQKVPYVCWHLLMAAVIMYAASLFFLFGLSSSALYYPSRYTRTTLILGMLFFVGLNWIDFLAKGPTWFRQKYRLLIFFVLSFTLIFVLVYLVFPERLLLIPLLWLGGFILSGLMAFMGTAGLFWLTRKEQWFKNAGRLIAFLIISIITIFLGFFYITTLGTRMMNPSENEREIYEFIETLPKDVLLAGDPVIMSGVPLFSKRSVLFRDLYPNVNPNVSVFIQDFFDAQYTESSEVLFNFCQRYDVGYLVLNKTDFTPEYLARQDFFYRPYNDKIIEMLVGRTDFILPKLEPIFTADPFMVIKCDAETVLATK